MSIEKPIFFLVETETYKGKMPAFFERDHYPWVKILEDNWQVIRDEFSEYILGKKELEQSSLNPPYLSDKNAWQNAYFWNFLWQKHYNCKRFPKTYQLLKSVPNLSFAEVTYLKPHSKILPHIGKTNVTTRGHLGLKITKSLPHMGIEVSGEARGWEEGMVVLFSDAHRHHVWNNIDDERYILVFDVIQEDFANKKRWMCAQALSSLTIKLVDKHVPLFRRLPNFHLHSFHNSFSALWHLYLPIQNMFTFLP